MFGGSIPPSPCFIKNKNFFSKEVIMIDYNYLKQVRMDERNSSQLTRIPTSFFRDCSQYFRGLELDGCDVRLYRNAWNCYSEIVERRLEKVNSKAYFRAIRTYKLDHDVSLDDTVAVPLNLHPLEYDLYFALLGCYGQLYAEICSVYLGTEE